MSSKLKVNNIIPSTGTQIGISTTGGGINLLTGTVVTGVVTATSFSGAVTGTASGNPTLANGSNNRVITATSSSALTGETNFTFDGQTATINGTSNDTPLIVDTTNSNGAHMRFRTNGSSQHFVGSGGGISLGDNEDLSFRAYDNIRIATGNNSTERLRITSGGQLLMTNAATQTFADFSTTNNNTRSVISLAGKTSGGAAVTLKMGGFGDTGRGEIFTHSNHELGFATNNAAAQWKMKTGGNFEIGDGNLIIGTAGHGIDFSATGDPTNGASTSELLDYYEEGTFTPAFGGLSSVSYSTQFGKYTRIGRQVFCTAVIDATGIDESNNITLTGLPYSSADSSDNQQRSTWLLAYGGHITGVSDATARFRSAGSSWQGVKGTASTSYLTGQQLSSSGTINITGSFSYYVA